MNRATLAILSLMLLGHSSIEAQILDRFTNPTVPVTLEHAPSLPLQVRTLAFGLPSGPCADAVNDRVISSFHASGMTIVDRYHLDTALDELDLQVSGLVNPNSAVQVGEMLGADALVFLKVRRCDTDHRKTIHTCTNYRTKRSYSCPKYHTEVEIDGNLRVIDLRSGRILASKTFGGSASASDGQNYPDAGDLLIDAEAMATKSIHRMFLPWTEQKNLVFFNDKACNLKAAAQLLRAGDKHGALALSLENLKFCRSARDVKPKNLMHAHYNVGMAHFALGDHEEAIRYFNQALRLGGGNIVTSSIGECKRARQLAQRMAQYEEDSEALRAELAEAPSAIADAPPSASRSSQARETSADSIEGRLLRLDSLKAKGLVTADEYQEKRAEILSDF